MKRLLVIVLCSVVVGVLLGADFGGGPNGVYEIVGYLTPGTN